MCRFVAYRGPPVMLDELIYKPEHSIIHQSVHAHERSEPLNGDGWGVGWYDPRAGEHPAVYRTLHPAWSDDNMRHISPLIETPAFFAHVRAASPGLPVQRLNCHPFRGGLHTHEEPDELDPLERGRRRLLFMHNGSIGAYRRVVRRLQNELDDDLFFSVQGSTDSEHAFALVQQLLGDGARDPSVGDLAGALEGALSRLNQLKREVGEADAETDANMALTDGEQLVVTRYTHPGAGEGASLYVGTAEAFYCDAEGYGARGPQGAGATLVASERLWDDDRVWQRVPAGHMVQVDGDGDVAIEPLEIAG